MGLGGGAHRRGAWRCGGYPRGGLEWLVGCGVLAVAGSSDAATCGDGGGVG
jgi:hypothetical protein